ncbi:dTDP-4-dehydrorhamnose 3,5-epimerase [Burkholderiales bacterium]|nr:dTDP-4-dehydrorhamnose 3,5-epimerase [Burkholderiales bacterium]
MTLTDTDLPGVQLIEPTTFDDERGFFYESFNLERFRTKSGLRTVNFVQDNHSVSKLGVLRGIHYQTNPMAQGKLVRVVSGEVFDVAVDLRRESKYFGRYATTVLSSENRKQIWIPEGFGHGFLALSDRVEMLYKTTNYYSSAHEVCIRWDDSDLGIEWPEIAHPIMLSDKDGQGLCLGEAELF